MNFTEVFPDLKLDQAILNEIGQAEIKQIVRSVPEKNLYIYMTGKEDISRDAMRTVEHEISAQLIDNMLHVEIIFCPLVVAANGATGAAPEQNHSSRPKYKRKTKGTEEGMLYGRHFEGTPEPISDILTEKNHVVVRGEIFEAELTETKNGTKIFKASVTDRSDSISIKMFLAEGEEDLPSKLVPGTLVSLAGKVEYDNYEGELLITRIEGIKPEIENGPKRMDNEPEKRVELHLHTAFSDMDALTDVNKLIKRAISWGHKAVAITDHGVVQGFPVAFHMVSDLKKDYIKAGKELDFKILYGCEGYLVDDGDMPITGPGDADVELIRRSAIPGEEEPDISPLMAEAIANVKKKRSYHIIILAANEVGRVNLYRLVSYAHVNYFNKRPRIPRSVLEKYREGLILGSACVMGELYDAVLAGKSEEELAQIIDFYDYLEIQPVGNNAFLVRNYETGAKGHKLKNEDEIRAVNRRICELGDKYGKKVVATGDVHFLDPEDSIYRSIIEDSRNYADADEQAPLYYRTTEEMLAEFDYLGEEKAREIVIANTNAIADMIEDIDPVRPDKCPPIIEDSDNKLRQIVYETAHGMYGDPLPEIVKKRIEVELNSIINNGYAVMYIIARELVQKSVSDGYLVGSRGSVGSSFVATMSGITEVNPLKAHYRCGNCKYTDFDTDHLSTSAGMSGCDMPDKICPVCGEPLIKDGFDIPFETFLGFSGDKEPDIDLNFSGEYQSNAHDYTEVIFGKGHTFRAGTIGTLQDKTVYGYVKHYCEKRGRQVRKCEINRLVNGCLGVKRNTGQHPGGIVVLPHGEEIYSFTPVQHPANDASKNIVTTHFEYHSIDHNLLKLDILGHDDPTMIKMLEDLTGFPAREIKFDDPSVLSLYDSTEALGIQPEDIGGYALGTLGVPEFGTDFVIRMLLDTKPKCFSDLVRIAGLSHGTDVWTNNAEVLVKEGTATLQTCICTRDDIMQYLIEKGVEPALSFNIMEKVRKGAVAKGKVKEWPEWSKTMSENNVPDWYIWSCNNIKYMFPKAHAVAYVMMAFRIAYYKIHYPLAYYAAFFSIRASAFDYELMCQGKEKLLENMELIRNRIQRGDGTPKDSDSLKNMYNVLEMYARGFEFLPLDVYRAGALKFRIIDGKLMPSFMSVDGMGEKAAIALEEEAVKGKFTSREDMRIRAKVSSTLTDKLYRLGALGDLPESSQLSLMDLFQM